MFGHKSFLRIGELADASIEGLYHSAYELTSCRYSFEQGTDHNGKAQTSVRGGSIQVIYGNIPPTEILEWMLKSNKLLNGAIVIYDANDMPVEKIFFEDAACINLNIKHTQKTKAYVATNFTIQARKLSFESITHENNWVKHHK